MPKRSRARKQVRSLLVPDRERKHAAQPLDERRALRFVEAQDDFGVAVRSKRDARVRARRAQLREVVDLAVVGDGEPAVGHRHRLMAGRRRIDDRQPGVRERRVTTRRLPGAADRRDRGARWRRCMPVERAARRRRRDRCPRSRRCRTWLASAPRPCGRRLRRPSRSAPRRRRRACSGHARAGAARRSSPATSLIAEVRAASRIARTARPRRRRESASRLSPVRIEIERRTGAIGGDGRQPDARPSGTTSAPPVVARWDAQRVRRARRHPATRPSP